MKEYPEIGSESPRFEVILKGVVYWRGIYDAAYWLNQPGASLGKRARLLDGTVIEATPEQQDAVLTMAAEISPSTIPSEP